MGKPMICPGRWSVDQMAVNQPAIDFWRKGIDGYTDGDFFFSALSAALR